MSETICNKNVSKDELLQLIKARWEQYPELRLGQLLINSCGKKDLFYVEDEELKLEIMNAIAE